MRRSELSEFSYGFGLTNELVGKLTLRAAPIFPNLVEEGRPGGGYDVLMKRRGVPLYIQFKLSEYMRSLNAKPAKCIINGGFPIAKHFYRFALMKTLRSRQHQMLYKLDRGKNEVLYAAPKFHTLFDMNKYWRNNTIEEESVLVSPRSIGRIRDNNLHHVAFDNQPHAYFCSEAKKVTTTTFDKLGDCLSLRLNEQTSPLSESLIEHLASARQALTAGGDGDLSAGKSLKQEPEKAGHQSPRAMLKELATLASRDFNAQLVIIQPKE